MFTTHIHTLLHPAGMLVTPVPHHTHPHTHTPFPRFSTPFPASLPPYSHLADDPPSKGLASSSVPTLHLGLTNIQATRHDREGVQWFPRSFLRSGTATLESTKAIAFHFYKTSLPFPGHHSYSLGVSNSGISCSTEKSLEPISIYSIKSSQDTKRGRDTVFRVRSRAREAAGGEEGGREGQAGETRCRTAANTHETLFTCMEEKCRCVAAGDCGHLTKLHVYLD